MPEDIAQDTSSAAFMLERAIFTCADKLRYQTQHIFFKWAALHVSRWGRGNGRLLFTWIVLLGSAVAALFANDGAGLILTPTVIATLIMLHLFFRRDIPASYDIELLESPSSAIKDPATFKAGWVVLVFLLAGFFVLEPLGIPVSERVVDETGKRVKP